MLKESVEEYKIPDEELKYSELKDRIREECARTLPRKERILLMAKKLEEDLTLKDTICDQICTDLGDVTSERHIQRCLPDEYKQVKKRRVREESTGGLATSMSPNDDKNVPEKTVTVNNTGYEAFEDIDRKDVAPASGMVKILQKKIEDVTRERDILNNENKVLKEKIEDVTRERDRLSSEVNILKEKTQPEMLKEIQERFYDEPGLIKGDQLQKVNEAAGKHIVKMLERYNSILNDSAHAGQPIPVGLYVIAKPEMVFVPVRFTVNFEKKRVDISLWEKKLA